MARRYSVLRLTLAIVIPSLVAGAAIVAQSAVSRVGMSENAAQAFVLDNISPGVEDSENHDHLAAFQKLPVSARGSVTTSLYGWTKAYVNSPAFKKAYAERRATSAPEEKKHTGTVDQEMKVKLDEMRAQSEDSYKRLLALGMKAEAEQVKKQNDELIAEMAKSMRAQVEEERAKDKADFLKLQTVYAQSWPADPLVLVARHLRDYLATTADVDFAARQEKVMTEAGESMGFVNKAYDRKPWQWQMSYKYGPEVTAAGRAAATAWLAEIGGKTAGATR